MNNIIIKTWGTNDVVNNDDINDQKYHLVNSSIYDENDYKMRCEGCDIFNFCSKSICGKLNCLCQYYQHVLCEKCYPLRKHKRNKKLIFGFEMYGKELLYNSYSIYDRPECFEMYEILENSNKIYTKKY